MSSGEAVTVLFPRFGAEDAHGDAVVAWEPVEVGGALVYELAGSDLADADRPDGRRVHARVQLPDQYMSTLRRDALKGCKVALTERGQSARDAYWVIGSPNHAPGMPTEWSTTIELGRVDG